MAGSYDAAKNPVVIFNFVGQIQILIADPQVLKDMFSTKNQLVDKTDLLGIMFKNFYEINPFKKAGGKNTNRWVQ